MRIGRLVIVLALVIVAAGTGMRWYYTGGILGSARFDAAYWRAPLSFPGDPECHRGRMVSDLRDRLLVTGMTAAAVTQLLGQPDEVRNGRWFYHLGACLAGQSGRRRNAGRRYDVLSLDFSSDHRLRSTEVADYW